MIYSIWPESIQPFKKNAKKKKRILENFENFMFFFLIFQLRKCVRLTNQQTNMRNVVLFLVCLFCHAI